MNAADFLNQLRGKKIISGVLVNSKQREGRAFIYYLKDQKGHTLLTIKANGWLDAKNQIDDLNKGGPIYYKITGTVEIPCNK